MTLRTPLLFVLVSTFCLTNRCQTDRTTAARQSDTHSLVHSEHVAGKDRYGYLCTLHVCHNGEFICNGVLVDPEMVLTAQYCFERLGQDFERSDIVVRCGARDEESQNLKSCIADIRPHDWQRRLTSKEKATALVLIRLVESMHIQTPSLAQPKTQYDLEDDLGVIFWKETGYEDEKSDLKNISVEYKTPENCNMTKATLNDPADYLCTTNPGDSCTDLSAEEMPKGGTARPLVSTKSGLGMENELNRLDLVFGIQAKIGKSCISNESQEALFIPVSEHTHWILNEIDELHNPSGCVEAVQLEEDVLFECYLDDVCGNDNSEPLSSLSSPAESETKPDSATASEIAPPPDGCLSEELECAEVFEDGLITKAVIDDEVHEVVLYLRCSEGCSPKNRSLLHLAAEYDSYQVAEILLEAGEDVNAPDARGLTALHYVAQNNSIKTLPVLLESHPDLSPATTANLMTPIHLAAYYDRPSIISSLVEEGADLNARNIELNTPLHLACAYGHLDAATVLMEADALCASRNLISWTPFDAICRIADCSLATVMHLENLFDPECH